MDAGYGSDTRRRGESGALGLSYIAGIRLHTSVWAPGMAPLPAKTWSGRGRPPARRLRDARHRPLAEERLLIEWPEGEDAPIKYWLSTLPREIAFARFVDLAKLRWRIERDGQELKQELGLEHYEGRGWRGFHRHATLCIAVYGFPISERETIPSSGPRAATRFALPVASDGYRPHGAAVQARTHIPNSIATVRRRSIVVLARNLPRCPCCACPIATANSRI